MSLTLSKIFEKCLSPDNILRRTGEQELFTYCGNNFYQTLQESCTMILTNEFPDEIRQFSGTFLKYIFSHENYLKPWNSLTKEQSELIKNSLMASLASEKHDVRQTSSLAIAALAKIEIPKGWNVIQVLFNTSHHENDNYRITSLLTFKNIIDFMGNKLKPEEINMMLSAFSDNLDPKLNQNVIHYGVVGIYSIIPFIENNFKIEAQRNFIINSLNNLMDINYINQVCLHKDIQKDILKTYIHIMKYYTQEMIPCFSKTAEITFRYFHDKDDVITCLSMEVWCTICDTEQELNKNLITSNYQDSLNDGIIRFIQERDTSSFDLGVDWTSVKQVMALISCLVLSGNKKVLEKMLSYISECLNNDLVQKSELNFNNLTNEEKFKALVIKQNAFFIYRGLLSYKNLEQEIIMGSLQKIISELKNINSFIIGESIATCLAIICKFHFNLINDSKKIFEQFFEQLLQLMQIHISNKDIEMRLLNSMRHIFLKTKAEYFNKYLSDIINILLQIAYDKGSYDKDCNLTLFSMFLIGKIIQISEDNDENKKIIGFFFAKLYSLFEESLNIKNFSSIPEQYCYQDNIISIISSCCGEYQKIKMNATQIKSVFDLIDKTIKQRKELFPDALLALGSLAYFGWELFSNINDQVMNYILISLDDKKNFALCYQGLLAADDIIRTVGSENVTLIPKIMDKMQKIIKDTEIPRGLKIKCFLLYNDIFLIQDKSIGDYLGEALELICDGMSMSIKPPSEEMDNDTIEYLDEFREKIVESLTSIFMFLSEQNQTNILSGYMNGFIKYLSGIVKPEYNPDMTLISEVGGLLADFYLQFKATVDLYLDKESLKIIIQKLEQSQNPQDKDVFLYIQQVFSDVISNLY